MKILFKRDCFSRPFNFFLLSTLVGWCPLPVFPSIYKSIFSLGVLIFPWFGSSISSIICCIIIVARIHLSIMTVEFYIKYQCIQLMRHIRPAVMRWAVQVGCVLSVDVPLASGFKPLRRGWVYRPVPEAPLLRGMPTGSEAFLEMSGACGLRPCDWTHPKKRPCAILVRLVGQRTNTIKITKWMKNKNSNFFSI